MQDCFLAASTVESNQKVSLVRFTFINRSHLIKPGMMAYVNFKRNQKRTLVISKSAILVGNTTTAWVKTAEGVYERRMIVPGIQNKRDVEVINALKEGEQVSAADLSC